MRDRRAEDMVALGECNKDDHETGENVVTTAVEMIDQSADPGSGSGGTNGDDVA